MVDAPGARVGATVMTSSRPALDTTPAPRRAGRAVLLVFVVVFALGILLVAEAARDYQPAKDPATPISSRSGPNG